MNDQWIEEPGLSSGLNTPPVQILRDRSGRAWVNHGDRLTLLTPTGKNVFSARTDLSLGNIQVIAAGRRDLFVGGDFGLARFDGRRFVTLRADHNSFLSRVAGIVEASNGDLWLNAIAGAVKISRSDLDHAFAHPSEPIRARVFDLDDGMPGVAQQDSESQTAMQASDGRIWFVTRLGIAWIDPKRLVHNLLSPPVVIDSLVTQGQTYPAGANLQLISGTTNLQIGYTAPSLSVPSRVRFRYQLEGVDQGWIDPGSRRVAFYTGLSPGHYRFRVIAANDDGVWNTRGAALRFEIPPTFLQSDWFKIVVLLAIGLTLWLLYLLRIRQMTERMQAGLEERLAERERIARELHDTLLQAFQGLLYRFQAVAEQLPESLRLRGSMEQALDLADDALAEGRSRVADLRPSEREEDLSQAFACLAERMSADFAGEFRVVTEGRPRRLHPIVRDEVTRIGAEAITNAFRHSHAEDVEVYVVYHPRAFRVSFRDNGVGIDEDVLMRGGRECHFGMLGIRERAGKIRASIDITSAPGSGTEITLRIASSIAYAQSSQRWPFGRRRTLRNI